MTLLLISMIAILPAAPILSDGNETCLPAPCTVQVITPHPSWIQEVPWISNADSGANVSMLTVGNGIVVSFFERFTIAGATSAPLRFAADDSASLWVNNMLVVPAAPMVGNGYSVCSDFGPTCWAWTEINIAPWLVAGENVLRFDVEQRGRYGFGLAFSGSITDIGEPPLPTPEPGTAEIVALALLFVALTASVPWRISAWRMRRRARKALEG